MARPIRVSILADPKDFVAGMKAAEQAAETAETTLSGTDKMFATLDASMSKIGGAADFIGGQFGRVGAGLTGVGDRITEMNPAWAGLGGAITETGKNLTFLADASDVVTGVMSTAQAALGLFKNSTLLSTIATQAATGAQWLMNAAMSANPIMIVVLAIAALVAGLIWFFTQTEVGRQAWAVFTAALTAMWNKFSTFMAGVWNAITGFFTGAANTVKGAWTAVASFFSGLPGKIRAMFDGALAWLSNAGQNVLRGLQAGATIAWNTVNGWFGGIPGKIKDFFDGAVGWLKSAGDNIVKGLWRGISDGYNWIKGKIESWVGNVLDFIKRLFGIKSPSTVMADMGDMLGRGLAKGILGSTRRVDAAWSELTGGFTADLGLAGVGATSGRVTQTYYSFGGVTFAPANAREASLLEEFTSMIQRKSKAGV